MNRFSRFHSINFILWLGFLIFAAFIIGMTWIFQTTLLRVFFKEQVKQDLDSLGQEATTVLSASSCSSYFALTLFVSVPRLLLDATILPAVVLRQVKIL